MKIVFLLLCGLVPYLTYAADIEQDWTAGTPSWQHVQEFRAHAEESRQDGYSGSRISVNEEADGAWELLWEAEDHRLTLNFASFTYSLDSGDEELKGEAAVEALIGVLLENAHGGQRLFSKMGALKEFLQGASAPFTPRQLAEAITAGIEAGVSAMASGSRQQHAAKEVLASWACRGPLFYALYNHGIRLEAE